MSKFNIGDKVKITRGSWKDHVGVITEVTEQDDELGIKESYVVVTEEKQFGMVCYPMALEKVPVDRCIDLFEKSLSALSEDKATDKDEEEIDYDYFPEMATVFRNDQDDILITVNSETSKPGIAYFKVYNNSSYVTATAVARLRFKDTKMEYHERDKKRSIPIWNIPNDKIKKVIRILSSPLDGDPEHTYWQFACYQWNYENNLIPPNSMQRYLNGDYDSKYPEGSIEWKTYVPSTQEMPPTWVFDPNKAKGKKVVTG